ncbi:MAG: DUF2817 domain-containing protein [Oligoflexia bacterium]|nr:DUF2817 domain-containing protein [Oligoflexia bacterium]
MNFPDSRFLQICALLAGVAAPVVSLATAKAPPVAPATPEAVALEPVSSPAPGADPKGLIAVEGLTAESAAIHERKWCEELSDAIKRIGWKLDPCQRVRWQVGGFSVKGRPLMYAEFGAADAENTTLVISGVHGDELTPQYVGLKLVDWLLDHREELKSTRVVVAPLVNPDGFLTARRTRVNANGVDVNRNFGTKDWQEKALSSWKRRYRSDPRRFPGSQAGSEPETLFQERLVQAVRPQKILSIHSPLNFLDYDGPTALSLAKFPKEYVQECLRLRARLKAVSGGFYPGSLGNFAGRELGIPTLTLELPSADPRAAERYWKSFSQGIRVMIEFSMPKFSVRPLEPAPVPRSVGNTPAPAPGAPASG